MSTAAGPIDAQLRVGLARAAFAALLTRHLISGTRPPGIARKRWTNAEFAARVPSSRSNDFVVANTISNWRRGKNLPPDIAPVLRALFGENRREEAAEREALREAFLAADAERNVEIIARAPVNPAAGPWVVADNNERFVHDPTATASDASAAANPLHQQLQQAIRGMAADLAEATGDAAARSRFGNSPTWKRLPAVAGDFRALVEREPPEIPPRLGEAYGLML